MALVAERVAGAAAPYRLPFYYGTDLREDMVNLDSPAITASGVPRAEATLARQLLSK